MFTASKAEVKKRFETLVAGDGRMIKCSGPLYVDQGIAVTNHASQGKTVDQVIVGVLRIWKPGNPQAFI